MKPPVEDEYRFAGDIFIHGAFTTSGEGFRFLLRWATKDIRITDRYRQQFGFAGRFIFGSSPELAISRLQDRRSYGHVVIFALGPRRFATGLPPNDSDE